MINEITADDAVVAMLRAEPGRAPKEFPIHHMELNQMSFDRPATFHAELTNPLPKGEIDSTGSFGPWDAEEPSSTPVDAKYTFRNADLGTLKGIIIAIIVSMVALAYQAADPPVYVLGRKPGTNVFRPRSAENPEDETFPGLLLFAARA